jgi:hypothetical protein
MIFRQVFRSSAEDFNAVFNLVGAYDVSGVPGLGFSGVWGFGG